MTEARKNEIKVMLSLCGYDEDRIDKLYYIAKELLDEVEKLEKEKVELAIECHRIQRSL